MDKIKWQLLYKVSMVLKIWFKTAEKHQKAPALTWLLKLVGFLDFVHLENKQLTLHIIFILFSLINKIVNWLTDLYKNSSHFPKKWSWQLWSQQIHKWKEKLSTFKCPVADQLMGIINRNLLCFMHYSNVWKKLKQKKKKTTTIKYSKRVHVFECSWAGSS